jgi:hypothetical protein
MCEMRYEYEIPVVKPERKRPLGRPRCRWKDNNKIYLKEIGCYDTNWIHLAQERVQLRALVNTVMNLWVQYRRGIS